MMFAWLRKYITSPSFEDQEKTRLAATLHVILITLLATAIFLIVTDWFTRQGANFPAMFFLGLFVVASLWLTRRGQLRLPRLLTPLIVLAVVSYMILINNLGVHDIAMLSYPGVIIMAGLLIGKRAPFVFAGLSIGVIAVIRYTEIHAGLASRFGALTDFSILISISIILGTTAALTYILMHHLLDSLAQARRNEASVIESHQQLQAYTQRLEEQEQALHEIEARFNIIVENSVDIIYIANNKQQVTFVSPQVAKFGITPEQIIGHSFLDFIYPDDRERLLANMEREITTAVDVPTEFRSVAPDGRIVLFEERGHIMRQGDQVMGIFGIIRDVTERRRAEEALRESEQKFRSIAEQVQDVISITDARGRITYISPSCAVVFGRPAADMLNHPFTEFLVARDVPLALAEFEKSMTAGQAAVELSLHMQRADGVEFVGGLRATVLCQEGVIAGTIGVIRDITERTRVEAQIRAALQEKEVLLREIHHRVKNNLQVISSLLNLQARTISGDCGRSVFDESQHRIKTMALIHEKLYQSESLTRIDFQEYTESLVRHLQASYGVAMQAIRFEIQVNRVNLTIDLAIPCGLIINELVSNALKYAFPGGSGAMIISLIESSAGGYELIISDNGIGLPEDFDLDRQSSLGLQLVKGLAEEQLGGQLHLLREQGTTWHIRF
jgi:PAS domain S-box-containing protein